MSLKNSTDQQPARAPTPGSWRPGQSGNPRGRPRKGNALAEAVRARVEPDELIEIALDLARNGESESTQLQALAWLRDSGYVKPAERHEVAAIVGGSRDEDDVDLDALSPAQLCAYLEAEREHGIEAPQSGKRRKNFLGTDELASVLAHVKANSPGWYAAVLLDVLSGLRWGELSALRWDDIDEGSGVIRVRRGNDKGRIVASTKTGDDDDEPKIVPLLPAVAEVLRERRQQMIAAQHPGLAEGWIFPTERGTLHKGSPLRDVLDAACAACKTKRRITPHGLRHTANDLLRRVADGEVVRAIIGHSTPRMPTTTRTSTSKRSAPPQRGPSSSRVAKG